MTREEIKTIIELFISWNGEKEPIDISNLDYAIEYINDCIKHSLPSNLDEAAKKEIERFCSDIVNIDSVWANMPLTKKFGLQMFKAGAEWREAQMKIPNSTELLSDWNYAKSILKEKDLRGDEWRLAYHAFLFGFTRGLNTKKSNE